MRLPHILHKQIYSEHPIRVPQTPSMPLLRVPWLDTNRKGTQTQQRVNYGYECRISRQAQLDLSAEPVRANPNILILYPDLFV